MREPYQDAAGAWVLFDGETKTKYASYQEATEIYMATNRKLAFVQSLQSTAASLGAAMDKSEGLYQSYFDMGFNSGGANEIRDEDVVSLGLTASQVTDAITLLDNFTKFVSGQAPAASTYRITINLVRT